MRRIMLHGNGHGRKRGDFVDANMVECSIQESSVTADVEGPLLWLGVSEWRMHLTQYNVRELMPLLRTFLETGRLGK